MAKSNTVALCQYSQVQLECKFIPSVENCHECLTIEVNEAYGETNICKTCGAPRAKYLEMMREPCWYGHSKIKQEKE